MSARSLLRRNHWIFDLDGTLTQPLHDFAAIRAALAIPAEQGILEFIAAVPEPARSRLDRQLTTMELRVARRAIPNPGAAALLGRLHREGVKLGILTRNRRQCVAIALARLGVTELFEPAAIVACEDVRPKPDPEGVAQLLAYWQAAPSDTLIVGDYRYDLEAGRAAGIATVLLDSAGPQNWPELTDLRVTSLEQLYHGRSTAGAAP